MPSKRPHEEFSYPCYHNDVDVTSFVLENLYWTEQQVHPSRNGQCNREGEPREFHIRCQVAT
jgi:hypothetical protein